MHGEPIYVNLTVKSDLIRQVHAVKLAYVCILIRVTNPSYLVSYLRLPLRLFVSLSLVCRRESSLTSSLMFGMNLFSYVASISVLNLFFTCGFMALPFLTN